jgi:isopenicillin N synthase-like dioxygenase
MTVANKIPLLDIHAAGGRLLNPALGACRIPLAEGMRAAIREAFAAGEEFFMMAGDAKRPFEARSSNTMRGWILAAADEKSTSPEHPRDYEAFDVVLPRPARLGSDFADHFFDHTHAWPTQRLRVASERLTGEVFTPLATKVWSLFEETASVAEVYFSDRSHDTATASIRYLHYQPAAAEIGFYAHRDYEMFAIHVENLPGIEVLDPDTQQWIRVELNPEEGLLIVGELCEILSQGRLSAATHRVAIPAGTPRRQAIVYFWAPGFHLPMPAVAGAGANRGDSVGQYLLAKFGKS